MIWGEGEARGGDGEGVGRRLLEKERGREGSVGDVGLGSGE